MDVKTVFVIVEIDDSLLHKDILTNQNKVNVLAVFSSRKDAEQYMTKFKLGRVLILHQTQFNPQVRIS